MQTYRTIVQQTYTTHTNNNKYIIKIFYGQCAQLAVTRRVFFMRAPYDVMYALSRRHGVYL